MKVTQTDKAITLDCGCNTSIVLTFDRGEFVAVQGTLTHCPLHVAAPKLLAALEEAVELLADAGLYSPLKRARAAIQEANK